MMKKLKLNADDLRVEEFRLQPDVAATRGTVCGLYSGITEPCQYCFPQNETLNTCTC